MMSVFYFAFCSKKIGDVPNNEKQRIKAKGNKKNFLPVQAAVLRLQRQNLSANEISTRVCAQWWMFCIQIGAKWYLPRQGCFQLSFVYRKQSGACYPPTYKILEVMNLNKTSHFSWQTEKKIILTNLS